MKNKIFIYKTLMLLILILSVIYYQHESTRLHEMSHVTWNEKFNCTESIVELNLFSNSYTKTNCTFKSEQEELIFRLGHQLTDSDYEENVYSNYLILLILALYVFSMT